jgi:hypothetical protein
LLSGAEQSNLGWWRLPCLDQPGGSFTFSSHRANDLGVTQVAVLPRLLEHNYLNISFRALAPDCYSYLFYFRALHLYSQSYWQPASIAVDDHSQTVCGSTFVGMSGLDCADL